MNPNEYTATVYVGFILISFKGNLKAGYVSVIGEGYSMSVRGESINKVEKSTEYFKVNTDIPWIVGTLLN